MVEPKKENSEDKTEKKDAKPEQKKILEKEVELVRFLSFCSTIFCGSFQSSVFKKYIV